jgi:hypothetical protein
MAEEENVTGMFERFEKEMHPSYSAANNEDFEELRHQRFVAGYDINDEAYAMELPVGTTLVLASLGSAVFWVGAAVLLRHVVRWFRS